MTNEQPPAFSQERRSFRRFPVVLPCYLVTQGKRKNVVIGKTINVSRKGVLISWQHYRSRDEIPSPGVRTCLELALPRRGGSPRYLRITGVVVRVVATLGQVPQVAVEAAHVTFHGDSGSLCEAPESWPILLREFLM